MCVLSSSGLRVGLVGAGAGDRQPRELLVHGVASFGLTLMLFNLLLITGRVRWRWLWLLFFLLMPFQFFTRHAYIRAISPSLMFMLLIILLMFRRRFVLTGLAVACYTHLYLGGVLYAPLVVGLFVISSVLGPQDDRSIPWRLIIWAAALNAPMAPYLL